jgi:hypothetical protein
MCCNNIESFDCTRDGGRSLRFAPSWVPYVVRSTHLRYAASLLMSSPFFMMTVPPAVMTPSGA